ncbi:MAG TPA: hypothetical protein VE251_00970 [Xanthobacteraceae bacterium]|jgi:hypothetical protein|nr:hypothetical protein [Xanthobacteraceae bacterium]
MIRIVATVDLQAALEAKGVALEVAKRILRHGMVTYKRAGIDTWDVLIERNTNDFPPAMVDWVLSRAQVLYVAEWELNADPATAVVLKGVAPVGRSFYGWPV